MTLSDVIQRLKTAEKPSGDLDDLIFEVANGYKKVSGSGVTGGMLAEDFWITGMPSHVIGGGVLMGRSPLFTFRLSDAVTLIESGFLFSVEGNANPYQQGKYGKARIWCSPEYSSWRASRSLSGCILRRWLTR